MFWIWSLFLLGIVSAQDDSMTTQASSAPTVGTTVQVPTTPRPTPTQAPITSPPTQAPPPTPVPTTPTPTQVSTTIATATTVESINSIYSRKSRKRYVLLQDSSEQLNAELDRKLQAILSAYEPECNGNNELVLWLKIIRKALKLGKNNYLAKLDTYIDFRTYNDRRLQLEQLINDRIDELNDLLPKIEPHTRCSLFYLNQRNKLKDAVKLSNAEKQAKLKENSAGCPYSVDEYDDDYYDYYFYYDYFKTQ